ncbi:TIGR02302 family protein [Mesorhizobium sp. BR1-1-16]|uniref:TIGR02302 family protein n=1 Tax=Mesorhizobium sp. BR1-1-16 TaxID=2876653 RepID=UPI001CCF6EAA|nr:TIGR02302 family protein [Mesorhizobium sp. BR1-1-16]MBZ9937341.1 TIGR02302 family protein [Mesorhizobium sp. BR1-1-16]
MTEPAGDRPIIDVDAANQQGIAEAAARQRIADATRRARYALAFETIWPKIVPLLTLAGVFLVASWLGLWSLLPDIVRFGLLGLFATVALFLLVPLLRVRWPSRDAAMNRVVRESGTPHRPAAAFADELALPTEDPLTLALWRAHRTRLLQGLGRLKAGWPSPGMNARDPYALRYIVPLLLVVAFMAAGADRETLIADALRAGVTAPAEAAPRIDAWVTPPAYTARPPIFLTGEAARLAAIDGPITVPEGSIVTIRMPEDGTMAVNAATLDGKPVPLELTRTERPASTTTAAPGQTVQGERRFALSEPGTVEIVRSGTALARWQFAVTPDKPPTIKLTREPGATASGALSLAYEVSDDYGVASAKAEITSAEPPPAGDAARPLVAAPEVPLGLPRLRMREGAGETIRDLSSHPWAGAKVRMALVATDEIGQTGRSAPVTFVLPARNFSNPLARAVVEQRRILALDAGKAGYVASALDAITLDPTKFKDDGVYLSLRAAYHRLTGARDDEDLVSVVDFLWQIALGIEDGDLSLAAQDLRAAQERLKNAIENNASDPEIDKAMQDLREAMNRYLEALARNAQQNPQNGRQQPNQNAQTLTPQDLKKLMDKIENLAKSGSREAAQQMLSELQQMMENLEAGRSQQAGKSGPMDQALDKLGDMIRRQQELMDKTFKLDPDTDGSGAEQQPMTPEERQQALDALRQGQQDLAKALEQLQKDMQGQGMQGDGKLGQAGRAMDGAAQQLGEGQPGAAVGRQGQALQALRDGARGLAEQMARQNGTGTRQGANGNPSGQDPLGRERERQGRNTDLGSSVKVPDAIDTQRAREILDTIRKRLGDAARPLFERDYLERLLQRY